MHNDVISYESNNSNMHDNEDTEDSMNKEKASENETLKIGDSFIKETALIRLGNEVLVEVLEQAEEK